MNRCQALFRRAMMLAIPTFVLIASACAPPPPPGRVYVVERPPRDRVEVITVAPGPNHVWIPGHWRRERNQWDWVPGRWARLEPSYRTWVPGHWKRDRHGWFWEEGHWR